MYKRQAQVHAEQHFGPVLGFRSAGAGLDIEKTRPVVHIAGKHALEFQPFDTFLHALKIQHDRIGCLFVCFLDRELEHFAGVFEARLQSIECADDVVEAGAFTPELLCFFGIVPDVRILQFPPYFLQAISLGSVVKDTP